MLWPLVASRVVVSIRSITLSIASEIADEMNLERRFEMRHLKVLPTGVTVRFLLSA